MLIIFMTLFVLLLTGLVSTLGSIPAPVKAARAAFYAKRVARKVALDARIQALGGQGLGSALQDSLAFGFDTFKDAMGYVAMDVAFALTVGYKATSTVITTAAVATAATVTVAATEIATVVTTTATQAATATAVAATNAVATVVEFFSTLNDDLGYHAAVIAKAAREAQVVRSYQAALAADLVAQSRMTS